MTEKGAKHILWKRQVPGSMCLSRSTSFARIVSASWKNPQDGRRNICHRKKAYAEGYITIEGAENILNKIKNLLSQVDQRVYISCTRNYLLLLIRELDALMEARKKVVIITDQPATFHNAKVYLGESRGMQVGVIADSKYVLTGEYGEGSMNTCLYSGQKKLLWNYTRQHLRMR